MGKKLMAALAALLAAAALSGCGTEEAKVYPTAYQIESSNRFDYQPGLECAAFASAYVLRHYGETDADGLTLFEDFPGKLPGGGIRPDGMIEFFTGLGYDARFVTEGTVEELKMELSKGAPVIVFIHTGEPFDDVHATHYVPAVGYDETYLYLAESLEYLADCKESGSVYNRKIEWGKFERLWTNIDAMWEHPYFELVPPS